LCSFYSIQTSIHTLYYIQTHTHFLSLIYFKILFTHHLLVSKFESFKFMSLQTWNEQQSVFKKWNMLSIIITGIKKLPFNFQMQTICFILSYIIPETYFLHPTVEFCSKIKDCLHLKLSYLFRRCTIWQRTTAWKRRKIESCSRIHFHLKDPQYIFFFFRIYVFLNIIPCSELVLRFQVKEFIVKIVPLSMLFSTKYNNIIQYHGKNKWN